MKTNLLQFALEIEAKGTQMYLALAAKTTNKLAKLLCYSLAAKEVEHARYFDSIYADIAQASSENVIPEMVNSIEDELKEYFKTASKMDLTSGKIPLAGYEAAMELERKTYAAYKKFQGQAATEPEKKFLARIMNEENEHYTALANVYLYLTDNGDWMQEDESNRWNWMNT